MGGGGGKADARRRRAQRRRLKLLARAVSGIDIKDLQSLADEGKKQVGSGVVAIVGVTEDGKAGIVVGVTADLTARFNAVDLVRKGAEVLGGKGGGGRPDMAQAGGPDGSKADAALKAIEAALRRLRSASVRRRSATSEPPKRDVQRLAMTIMAQLHFTSWLREVVPDGPLQADGGTVGDALGARVRANGRMCAATCSTNRAACASTSASSPTEGGCRISAALGHAHRAGFEALCDAGLSGG